jgi:uncharacterized damage-inducible protein DinB
MNPELERFLTLFEGIALSTDKWMAATPADKLDWTPVDNPNMKFGDRISTITIRSVFVHVIVGECWWAKTYRDCEDGEVFTATPNPELTDKLMKSADLVGDARKLHEENMDHYRNYSDEQLNKKITWMGREWTIMGFLWAIYSHRSYHLGNMDIYLREADAVAPDFFSSFQPVMA